MGRFLTWVLLACCLLGHSRDWIIAARCVEQTLDLYLNAKAGRGRPKEKLRTLSELAKGTSYSAEYLSLQTRKDVLDAVKVGKVWMSTRKTIEAYKMEHGRKRSS